VGSTQSVVFDSGLHADAQPKPIDTGIPIVDAGFPDNDAGQTFDSGQSADTGTSTAADAGAAQDASAQDANFSPDASTASDAGIQMADGGLNYDTGLAGNDWDNDFVSNADEGNGLYDSDGDGTPDAFDLDSDNDGIPDSLEAGDNNLTTPPIDTDNNGIPDLRDTDSDDDLIPDLIETSTDTDGDGIPNYRDLDSDQDGISDRIEGYEDGDADLSPNFLDHDSDGDGIEDAIETYADDDNDDLPNANDLDSDGDAIPDTLESTNDFDGDMIPNFRDRDADGDFIADRFETINDRDNDGSPNYLDLDSDSDGIPDEIECGHQSISTAPFNQDGDALPNFLDHDSDNDFIADEHETSQDHDLDGLPNFIDVDTDNDLITDNLEAGDTSTVTPPADFDNDSIPNYLDADSDGDSIADAHEGLGDPDQDTRPNYLDDNSDGDRWIDSIEAGDTSTVTPPADTDGDNVPDYLDLDSDDDQVNDDDELGCPMGPDRILTDSDGDSLVDSVEIAYSSDPCDSSSVINAFYFELPPSGSVQTAPLVFSNTDIDRSDIAINLDTTASMGDERANLINSLTSVILTDVRASISDSAFSISSFEDYPIFPFGSPNWGPDLPFRLLQRITTDPTAIQLGVQRLGLRTGSDLPEAGLESLYQLATGAGTSWTGGTIPAFDADINKISGVADGSIGGAGFRTDSLPIIVHITDAHSHVQEDYIAVDPSITAASTSTVFAALEAISARVVTIASSELSQPLNPALFGAICDGTHDQGFGVIPPPRASDEDWFEIPSSFAGQTLVFETFAARAGSTLDTEVFVFDGPNNLGYYTFDYISNTSDARAEIQLNGTGPFYVKLKSEIGNGGTNTETIGFYFFDAFVNGVRLIPSRAGCYVDHGNTRATATRLDLVSNVQPISTSTTICVNSCSAILDTAYNPDTLPYTISERTRATVPTCAWDVFGAGRPAGCGPNECCTGLQGRGESPNSNNECPLAFNIEGDGTGLDSAIVTGIQALTQVAGFKITTHVRPDPLVLANEGIDTSCFIRSIIPQLATNTLSCAPTPEILDLTPPFSQPDTFNNIAPGTRLEFLVESVNTNATTGLPCVESLPRAQIFTAYLDVIADGVTTLETKDIVIIVPGDQTFAEEK